MLGNNIVIRGNPRGFARHLMELEVFQKNRLRLYCGVPVSDLAALNGSDSPPPGSGWFTFLICRGDTALLAANLPPEEWDRGDQDGGVPGLLTLELPEATCVSVCQTIEQALKRLLSKERTYGCRFLGHPVPPERLPELARAQMVEQSHNCMYQQLDWLPTEYGTDCGLVLGYVLQDDGDFQEWPWCSEQTDVYLKKILAWEPAGTGTQWKDDIPFSQRVERLNRGLHSDSSHSTRTVRRFAETPLDDYLKEFPKALAELRKAMPMLGASATYQDAAVLVYWLLQDRETRPKELRDLDGHLGRRLMEHLALPLLGGLKESG